MGGEREKDSALMTIISELHASEPPHMRITWAVLEAAKYAGDGNGN